MKKSISEMAKISGVSVRTLHYYDEIGLLKPSEVVAENGYRYYDEGSLERLQQILFYRELDFSLKEIVKLMNASHYNKKEALSRQRELLKLKRNRLNQLIELLSAKLEGDATMSFKEFDTTDIEKVKAKYAEEVQAHFGETEAYRESQKKMAKYTKEEWQEVNGEMQSLLKEFAGCLGDNPASEKVQGLVTLWQKHITDYYYDCTKQILSGLGEMYVLDERFTKNIDKYGEGTAKFMQEAFKIYCE